MVVAILKENAAVGQVGQHFAIASPISTML